MGRFSVRRYSLYSIKTIKSMESPHKDSEPDVCVCVCVKYTEAEKRGKNSVI